MSAVEDLSDWIEEHDTELYERTMKQPWHECVRTLGQVTGTYFDPFWMSQSPTSMEHACRHWLGILKGRAEMKAKQAALPEVPPECHNTRPISSEACAAATKALCAGTR